MESGSWVAIVGGPYHDWASWKRPFALAFGRRAETDREVGLSQRTRHLLYAGIACGFGIAAAAAGLIKARALGQPFDLPVSDGRHYYAYLPSLVVDGDLDFANQIIEHWGPDFHPDLLADRTPIGRIRNKYPIGLALTLAPAFLGGHAVALASNGRIPADGYSWPYQLACLAMIEWLVYCTLRTIDDLAINHLHVHSTATALGVAVWAVGTPYAYYACREPFMVHAVSAFWCTTFAAAMIRRPTTARRFWLWFGAGGAMALACRPTNAHLAPLAIYGVIVTGRHFGWKPLARAAPWALVGAIPLALQTACWRALAGQWIYFSYAGEGFAWTAPELWRSLLSGRHGLFAWSPLLLPAAVLMALRSNEQFVRAWLLSAALLWYANAAWSTWWFGDAFGGRAYLELAGFFGLGLALLFAKIGGRAAFAVAGIACAGNLFLMALYITHRIPRAGSLLPW